MEKPETPSFTDPPAGSMAGATVSNAVAASDAANMAVLAGMDVSAQPAAVPQPASGSFTPRERKPWLLIYNCQAMGLGNCLNLLCDSILVEAHDPATYGPNAARILANLDGYERILVAPFVEIQQKIDFGKRDNVWRLPTPLFTAYHPDLCYLAADGPLSRGPLGHYHSAIAFAAFRCGLTEQQALALYCEDTYQQLGYFDRWSKDREVFIGAFKSFGFEIGPLFTEWTRSGSFMHSINHPKIHCLRDIAIAILERAGKEVNVTDILPHDNLTSGPVFPVYPEIGTRLGVRGSYLFKPGGAYTVKGLEHYLSDCYRIYRGTTDLTPSMPVFFPTLDRALTLVKGA